MRPQDLDQAARIDREDSAAPWTAGCFRDALLGGYHCIVAESGGCGGGIVGFAVMLVQFGEAHLLHLCVAGRARQRGYGRMLVERCKSQAADSGARDLSLRLRRSNTAALKLYLACGLEVCGVRQNYYFQGSASPEDALVMTCRLQAAQKAVAIC